MTYSVKVAACQLPEIRQDIDGALSWIQDYCDKADSQDVKLVCFPECYLQGYLCESESARTHALNLASPEFAAILRRVSTFKCMIVLGLIEIQDGRLFNTAVVIHRGELIGRYRKTHLLDGEAIFDPGSEYPIFEVGGLKFGINICYDTNFAESVAALAEQDAHLIVCPANNMMRRQTAEDWKSLHNTIRAQRAKETGLWLISSDVTGERDGRISYGPTAVIDPTGNVVAQVPLLETGMVVVDLRDHWK
jgi:predicted amidohydrolase